MAKNSKSTATIRRRKNKPDAEFLSKVRKCQSNKTACSNLEEDAGEGDTFFYKEVLRSSAIEKIMSSDKTIFLGLLVIRLVNAMLMQTFFVPDEFWQSVEVAHKLVFDYGYMTWEWQVGIRSYAYPLLFATLYKVLHVLGMDNRLLLIRGPRLVQGALASVGDLYLYYLSRRLAGRDIAQWTLLCQLLSWFTSYCVTRTLSNSMETVLVIAALHYFPWPGLNQPKYYSRRFVVLAAWSVVVRPTAAVLWVLLCSWHLQQSKGPAVWSLLRLYLTTGLTVLGISTVIDSVWYGKWILVHLNFLQFNVLSGGSGFYGSHPWHWYLTQGLPVVLGAHFIPFVFGAWQARNKVLLLLLLWKIFVLSFLAHKEFRFLLPILPLAMHYCGVCFHSLATPPPEKTSVPEKKMTLTPDKPVPCLEESTLCAEGSQNLCKPGHSSQSEGWNATDEILGQDSQVHMSPPPSDSDAVMRGNIKPESGDSAVWNREGEGDFADAAGITDPSSASQGLTTNAVNTQPERGSAEKKARAQRRRARKVRCLVILLASCNILPLLYFSLIHQRGTIDVMNYLHDVAVRRSSNWRLSQPHSGGATPDILFLMPCHSTPYYSFLHVNVSMRFLTCPPNLGHAENYSDEADVFYRDPAAWLREEYHSSERSLPSHLVYFNVLQPSIEDFLLMGGYHECTRFFHSHFPEGRVGSHVLVSCR